LEAGRAVLAVDENFRFHANHSLSRRNSDAGSGDSLLFSAEKRRQLNRRASGKK
jgi:hypothetical protein